MVTLIEKKERKERLVKNWRPISLMNVDVKIVSKALSFRLNPIRPGGGGSEARMAKLTAANQKPPIL